MEKDNKIDENDEIIDDEKIKFLNYLNKGEDKK